MNVKLTIEYVGTRYCGWQIQPNGPSVQAALEAAWERLTGAFARFRGAGRTDAGVHARGQVANVRDVALPLPVERLARALNTRLPDDIVVRCAESVPADFDARRGCLRKRYRYRVATGWIRPGREADFCWHVRGPLDFGALAETAARAVGTHDFAAFAKAGADGPPTDTVRSVDRAQWYARPRRLDPVPAFASDGAAMDDASTPWALTPGGVPPPACADGYWVWLDIEGRSFLYNMVRALSGTMVDAAQGRLSVEEFGAMLTDAERRRPGRGAPARGLCLEWIRYP